VEKFGKNPAKTGWKKPVLTGTGLIRLTENPNTAIQ
jgi:hypothetical protein